MIRNLEKKFKELKEIKFVCEEDIKAATESWRKANPYVCWKQWRFPKYQKVEKGRLEGQRKMNILLFTVL